MPHSQLFRGNNGYANAPQRYVIRTLFVLLNASVFIYISTSDLITQITLVNTQNVSVNKIVDSYPLIRSIGNYSLADLHRQYKKYIHKRPKHILL